MFDAGDARPELPPGWALTTLKDIVEASSGETTQVKGRLSAFPDKGLVPAFSASGQDVWSRQPTHTGPGVVLSAIGARCGKCFLALGGQWSAIANTHVFQAVHPDVDTYFLFLILNNEKFWIRGGTAQPFVKI